MHRKKEIIIIILIILTTIFLAFLPKILENKKVEIEKEDKKNTILVTIEGEIKESSISLTCPNGVSFGYILSKIEIYLNDYSIISESLTKRYYEDTVIIIESSDKNCYQEEDIDLENKISLSKATLDELVKLYGIGEKRAITLIEYRETHTLDSWEKIRSLLGVSDAVIESIKEKAVL